MNTSPPSGAAPAGAGRAEILSGLFASMVIQQTNMALMFLGKMPHPQSGQSLQDIDSAKLMIDQLEMLELKTRGNLDPREERLLKQSLTSLRMAFVEAVDRPTTAPEAGANTTSTDATAPSGGETGPTTTPEDESHKRFSKKY